MTTRAGRVRVVLLAALLAVTLPGTAVAQPEVELEAARERAADLGTRVGVAERRLEEARQVVADLEGELREAGGELERSQAEQAEAEASAALARRRAARAVTQLRAVEAELDDNQDALAAFARETYKQGAVFSSPTALTLRSLAGGGASDLADSLQAMRLGLRSQRRVVEEAQVLRTLAEVLADAARADGIVFGGSGYRSPDAQAALRRANGCPDVWTSPASECRVPTAIPGSSEHEKGLAVDFTYGGRTICFPRPSSSCSGDPAFDWLRANAGRYGLINMPSEAWHWSTTGR